LAAQGAGSMGQIELSQAQLIVQFVGVVTEAIDVGLRQVKLAWVETSDKVFKNDFGGGVVKLPMPEMTGLQ
jgi:hypothetical protein